MLVLMIVTAILSILSLIFPFFWGPGGRLLAGSAMKDPQKIAQLKQMIVQRMVEEEKSHSQGELSDREWKKRKQFLTHFYMDLSYRDDFIQKS